MVWQYLLPVPEHGKPAGWHPYTLQACETLSQLQLQSVQNNSKRTVYHVKSGFYSYEVNVLSLTQRNLTTGKLRQIRQHCEIPSAPPTKKHRSTPLALEALFGGGCAHVWEPILTPFISSLPAPQLFIGCDRNPTIVPVRELTFQAIKPLPPPDWRVIILGQNPYPRLESATGVAMFDAAFDDWKSPKFGSTVSMRCIIKAAAMDKYGVEKKTTVAQLRSLIAEQRVVSPPQWFQAMLAQGILLLNASLTTGGPFSANEHAKFWRPVIERIIEEVVAAKTQLPGHDNRRALLFLWWGSLAQKMKKRICRILDKFSGIQVKHIDWYNPAAQGDKFCHEPPHFTEVNKQLRALEMQAIDWLPTEDWLTSAGATSGAFGEFISNTKELHKMFLERMQNGLEMGENIEPITGVRKTSLKSIIEACGPFGLSSAAQHSLSVAKTMGPESQLSQDQKAAIHLYTGNALYSRLNRALRNADRTKVKCYYSYLVLFLLAHDKIMPEENVNVLYRGISKDLTSSYTQGKVVTWWGISSCSSSKEVSQSFAGNGTLFLITPKTAVPIMEYSAHDSEEEYVLAPGTRLEVTKVVKTCGLSHVHMTEVDGERLVS